MFTNAFTHLLPSPVIYSENPDIHASIEEYVQAGVFTEAMGHRIAAEFIFPEEDTVYTLAKRSDAQKASEGNSYWKWTIRHLEDRHRDLTQRVRHLRSRRGAQREEAAIRHTVKERNDQQRLLSFVKNAESRRTATVHSLNLITTGQRSLVYPTVQDGKLISTKRQEYLLQVAVTYLRKIAGV